MLRLIDIQVSTIMFVIFSVLQQRSTIQMMIKYVPGGTDESKSFHQSNASLALVFFLLCASVGGVFGFVLSILCYNCLFNQLTIRVNWPDRNPFVLGTESAIDRLLTRMWGSRAGFWLFIISMILLGLLNAVAILHPSIVTALMLYK